MTSLGEKRCRCCGETKSLEAFVRDRSRPDGRHPYCKPCKRAQVRAARAAARYGSQREAFLTRCRADKRAYDERHRDRRNARRRVQTAVRSGRLKRPAACERCGKPGQPHAHHDDYSKPLEVEWLCLGCHQAHHRPDVVAA